MSEQINKIQKLFKINLSSIPNSEFYEQGEPIIIDGKEVRTYSKMFIEEDDFEYGLFDSIDVKIFKGLPNKNIIFTNESIVFGDFEFNQIENLINSLYQIYGCDDLGNGKYSSDDRDSIEFGYLNRNWSENKNLAMLNFDEDEGLSFTIWLTEKHTVGNNV